MASIHIERFMFFKSGNQHGFGFSFILHGRATFLNCTFIASYTSLHLKQHHREPAAYHMTANSTLQHIRFLMSTFKMEVFILSVWQVAAKISFTQCNITLQVLYPQVEGANNTSSGFWILHIGKSLVSRCTIAFTYNLENQLLTSIIHVEITESRLHQTTFLQ